jgi:hypothetical protein
MEAGMKYTFSADHTTIIKTILKTVAALGYVIISVDTDMGVISFRTGYEKTNTPWWGVGVVACNPAWITAFITDSSSTTTTVRFNVAHDKWLSKSNADFVIQTIYTELLQQLGHG